MPNGVRETLFWFGAVIGLSQISKIIYDTSRAISLAELVVKPVDTEVLVDELTYFNCSTSIISQDIQWLHYPAGDTGNRSIVYGYNQFYYPYKNRFMIEKNEATGTFNLIIRSVQIQDAGKYECQDDGGRGANASAHLVVLDSSTVTTRSNTKPYVAAILVICFFLIPIIIVASLAGGIYIQKRLRIFDRLVKRKDLELRLEETGLTTDEDYPTTKSDATDIIDALTSLQKNTKSTEEKVQQYEQLRRKILELAKSNDDKKMNIDQLEKRITKLEEEQRELEERLYPTAITSYTDKPKLVSVIEIRDPKVDSNKELRPIFGMALLRGKLFSVTEKSSEIEVCDSVALNQEQKYVIAEMSSPLDIASCDTNNCLYISDESFDKGKYILRVDVNNPLSFRWSIRGGDGPLSVTRNASVVVCLFNGTKIREFSSDGKLIRTISLSPADNISHPWHAIKTTGMHFIFSHGISDDPLHRVCVANADGKIIKSVGGKKGSDIKEGHMNRPVHLLEDSSRNILVADMKNKRVLLLSQTLEYKRILVSADTSKLRFPLRLCLDEERGILFVADNNYKEKTSTYDSGRILIFNCKT